jgi:renalase
LVDVFIVGSGIAGLMAASQLKEKGHTVQVIDKGRNPGGRLASRQARDFVFNHGCGSLDLDPQQISSLAKLSGLSLDSGPYLDTGAINEIARQLTHNLPVLQGVQAENLSYEKEQWLIKCHNFAKNQQEDFQAKVLLLTLPAPQATALLKGVAYLGASYNDESYDPQLVVMLECALDAPLAKLARYGKVEKGAIKNGVQPCMLRCTPAQTATEMEESLPELKNTWSQRVQDVGQLVSIHRWKYAHCQSPQPKVYEKHDKLPLYIAGDSFGDKELSGLARAFESGQAAGQAISQALR